MIANPAIPVFDALAFTGLCLILAVATWFDRRFCGGWLDGGDE